jgi:hypothetical protein
MTDWAKYPLEVMARGMVLNDEEVREMCAEIARLREEYRPLNERAKATENGVCDYAKVWNVTTYTSGNELRGPAVHFGEFTTERDARQSLADAGFTNGQFGWRKGYTDATISPKTVYSNHREPSAHIDAQDAKDAKIKALVEYVESIADWMASNGYDNTSDLAFLAAAKETT